MKKQFKILLLILVSFCYGNTVFEFSDTEKKANFENESHVYVQQHHNHDFGNDVTQSFPHFDNNLYFNFVQKTDKSKHSRLESRDTYGQ